MAFARGARLGPYEIVAPLGAGGMGEVYRARDTRLKRDVAIKVLPEAFAKDLDRLARFQREAELLATLSHPNIAAVYGLEKADPSPGSGQAAVTGIVLELVEGETLADLIGRGPIAIGDALPIARQIADALDAAHEKGITHRDLKPANIKITPEGNVKVLDFGLAKAAAGDGSTPDLTQSPTVTIAGTREGVILGTAAYMSPEQARGKPVDTRTDIWAFGCVLYEMLTGRGAFKGDTVSDTIAAILEREPDWQALPPAATPLTGVLRRCLEKDVKRRLRDIGDVKLLLDDTTRVSPTTTSLAVPSRRAWWIAVAAVLGVIVGGTAVALLVQSRIRTIPQRVGRFELTSSQADPFTADPGGANIAIAPDGSRLVYTATRSGVPELVMRRLDQLEASPIAGTDGGSDPFFSPDGQQIGFSTGGELKRVAAEGGTSVTICQVDPTFTGASWGPNNAIVFGQGFGLFRVSATGGLPEKLAAPDATRDEEYYDRPAMLPGGQAILYTVVLRSGQRHIAARRLGGGDAITMLEGGFGPQYLPSGHLLYAMGDRVMAIRFDVTTLQVAGSAVLVQEGVFTKIGGSLANVASAADGTTVYVAGLNTDGSGRPVWVDRRGTHVAPVVEQPLEFPRNPRLSPDGRRLALTVGPSGLGHIWVYDLGGTAQPVKLTFQDHNTFPIWSPDGKQIVFMSLASSSGHMSSIPADGSAVRPEPLTTSNAPRVPMDWSPDGAFVLFLEQTKLSLLHVSDGKVRPWLQTPFAEFGGRFSSDGHWVAYASDQSGASEVWVRPFPGPGAPVRVSSDGGHDPVWSRDDKEIFYDNGQKLLSARVASAAPDLRVDAPRVLFEGGFVHDTKDMTIRFFDVAPDGRFLMIEPTGTARAASIIVAQHWDEELKRLLPTR
jgi:serine/threonine protein kinase/Tol biopolymer transport system component